MIQDKILERIAKYVKTNYTKLDKKYFILGDMPYNYMCHFNSVQKIKEGKAAKVFLCVAIRQSDNRTIVHFINQLEDRTFIDHTWGWVSELYDYYVVKEVVESEFMTIDEILESTKQTLIHSNSNWLERKLSRTDLGLI